ncbi:DUF58 domain-containing protein [Melioribacteraceae bacterium 4301-Me]|uniref:DUF58 domain-containing protein n=1 Tax=Pyranulibacter aquaticus TaxID=3163344 RepID=UPI00359AE401
MTHKNIDYKKYLDTSIISKIKNLELRARMVVEGFMIGLHKSPYHGFSVEFTEHRQYMQGDSLKDIDWKVYAKRERFYVKQYEEETNLISHVIVDISNSMDYKHSSSVTKLEYAITLAAALVYIMINQQDASGLVLFSDKIQSYLPPKSNQIYLKTLLAQLSQIKAKGLTNTGVCLREISEKIKKRGLVIIISDLFDDPSKIIPALKYFRYKKNEVIVLQLLDPMEINFAFEKDSIFVDKETGLEINTQPRQIQKAYQTTINNYLHNIKSECLNHGIEYNLIDTSEPFDKALMSYFFKRKKLY